MSEEAVKILFRDLKPKELLIVTKEIKKIINENEKLNNKINEAIEFINGGKGWKKYKYTHQEEVLLSILKEDK